MEKEFNPADHIKKIGFGDNAYDYLPVEFRVKWLRESCPDATIDSDMIHFDGETVVFKVVVSRPDTEARSTAHAMKSRVTLDKQNKEVRDPEWLQKCESKALGRALANLGFGTENIEDDGEPESVPAPRRITENQSAYLRNLKSEFGAAIVDDEMTRLGFDVRKITEDQARDLIREIEKKLPAGK